MGEVADLTLITKDGLKLGLKEIPKAPEVRVSVEFRPGRWGKVFHIFDLDNREICLQQKDAVKLARSIIRIAREQK